MRDDSGDRGSTLGADGTAGGGGSGSPSLEHPASSPGDGSSSSSGPLVRSAATAVPAAVPAGSRSWALAELDAPPPDAEQVLVRRAALAARRAEAEAHHHRDVWVKDPHGGPYRKALARGSGRGAAAGPLAVPDPRRPAEPGYEVVEVGPTTNFVGNAMSTGAVDLVLAQLEQLRNHRGRPKGLPAPAHRTVPPALLAAATPAQPSTAASDSVAAAGAATAAVGPAPTGTVAATAATAKTGAETEAEPPILPSQLGEAASGSGGGEGDRGADVAGGDLVAGGQLLGSADVGRVASGGMGPGAGLASEEVRLAEVQREARRLLRRARGW
ncbi:hypothetical protein PLESTM_000089900 [Pleodorina starrii]|nr:hypothetical protein PLESTM_000089900 [Pleodorina starrii]